MVYKNNAFIDFRCVYNRSSRFSVKNKPGYFSANGPNCTLVMILSCLEFGNEEMIHFMRNTIEFQSFYTEPFLYTQLIFSYIRN